MLGNRNNGGDNKPNDDSDSDGADTAPAGRSRAGSDGTRPSGRGRAGEAERERINGRSLVGEGHVKRPKWERGELPV
jgi:hypothetical protein